MHAALTLAVFSILAAAAPIGSQYEVSVIPAGVCNSLQPNSTALVLTPRTFTQDSSESNSTWVATFPQGNINVTVLEDTTSPGHDRSFNIIDCAKNALTQSLCKNATVSSDGSDTLLDKSLSKKLQNTPTLGSRARSLPPSPSTSSTTRSYPRNNRKYHFVKTAADPRERLPNANQSSTPRRKRNRQRGFSSFSGADCRGRCGVEFSAGRLRCGRRRRVSRFWLRRRDSGGGGRGARMRGGEKKERVFSEEAGGRIRGPNRHWHQQNQFEYNQSSEIGTSCGYTLHGNPLPQYCPQNQDDSVDDDTDDPIQNLYTQGTPFLVPSNSQQSNSTAATPTSVFELFDTNPNDGFSETFCSSPVNGSSCAPSPTHTAISNTTGFSDRNNEEACEITISRNSNELPIFSNTNNSRFGSSPLKNQSCSSEEFIDNFDGDNVSPVSSSIWKRKRCESPSDEDDCEERGQREWNRDSSPRFQGDMNESDYDGREEEFDQEQQLQPPASEFSQACNEILRHDSGEIKDEILSRNDSTELMKSESEDVDSNGSNRSNRHSSFLQSEYTRLLNESQTLTAMLSELRSENELLKVQIAFPIQNEHIDATRDGRGDPLAFVRTQATEVVLELNDAVEKIRSGLEKGFGDIVEGMTALRRVEQRLASVGGILSL
ncbi:hypothetical protein BDR26DRAFT_854654 [Obelidium mucronatum]|nr:hypothetical protein BDR26DRAFT_854654 [Obelidium mucronatum]